MSIQCDSTDVHIMRFGRERVRRTRNTSECAYQIVLLAFGSSGSLSSSACFPSLLGDGG